jgi:AcrR family transcriptional regulator
MAARARLGRPAGADGEQTRKRIMLVAMEHVAERGYSRATLKEIAADAGLTSATIYHYFPSELDLVATTFTELLGRVIPRLEGSAARAETLPEILTIMLDEAIEPVREFPHLTAFHAPSAPGSRSSGRSTTTPSTRCVARWTGRSGAATCGPTSTCRPSATCCSRCSGA